MKLDILVGLESMRGKLILVERLGRSRPGFRISSEEGLGSLRSLLTRVAGFSLPAGRTRWDPPGGGLGSMRPVPVPQYRPPPLSPTGVRRAWRVSGRSPV